MEEEKLGLKKGDICILFLTILVMAVLLLVIANKKQGNCVYVTANGETKTYSLLQEDEIIFADGDWLDDESYADVTSANITNIVVIDNGHVYMKEANCPDQVCVNHKSISKQGEMIICLPNQIFLEVESDVPNEIDN